MKMEHKTDKYLRFRRWQLKKRNIATQAGCKYSSPRPFEMSAGSNLALAAPLGLQLPGFANALSPQTGLLQQALRPKMARVLHRAFTRPSHAMFAVATLLLSRLAKCVASTKMRSDAGKGFLNTFSIPQPIIARSLLIVAVVGNSGDYVDMFCTCSRQIRGVGDAGHYA